MKLWRHWQNWLISAPPIFLVAVSLSLMVTFLAWATDGGIPTPIILLPSLLVTYCALLSIYAIVASTMVVAGRNWRWLRRAALGSGAALTGLLPTLVIWPDALVSAGGLLRWQVVLGVLAMGGGWALMHEVRRHRRLRYPISPTAWVWVVQYPQTN